MHHSDWEGYPVRLGLGQNEQPSFSESVGTSSTGTQLTGTGAYLIGNIFYDKYIFFSVKMIESSHVQIGLVQW
jgi:hypothetical protein